MRSEIRSIRVVQRPGAAGDAAFAVVAVYGRRPDGKTALCKFTVGKDGAVAVASSWKPPGGPLGAATECRSEFTAAEWAEICRTVENFGPYVCNRILDKRGKQ